MSEGGTFGDATPAEAWDALSSERKAVLVDVRTQPEWSFVGLPDLSGLGGEVIRLEWQTYPSMQVDRDFTAKLDGALQSAGADSDTPVFFLCRSGARSAAAAAAMARAGYRRCFNIVGGFEGARDEAGHRGTVEGWKAAKLPWGQS